MFDSHVDRNKITATTFKWSSWDVVSVLTLWAFRQFYFQWLPHRMNRIYFTIVFQLNFIQVRRNQEKTNFSSSRSVPAQLTSLKTSTAFDPPMNNSSFNVKMQTQLTVAQHRHSRVLCYFVDRKVFHWNEKRTFRSYFDQWKFVCVGKICIRMEIVSAEVMS